MTPEQTLAYETGIEALEPYRTEPYGDLRLNAARASAKVVMAITEAQGKTIVDVCGCSQPVGRCELCDGPRCWRSDPWTEPLPVPCGQCMVCAGRIVGGDGECYAASQKCDHTPTPRSAETPQDAPPAELEPGSHCCDNCDGIDPGTCLFNRPAEPKPCQWFQWIGQPWTSCDNCGQPAWDHNGELVPADGPFGDMIGKPWGEGEADRMRQRFAPTGPVKP